MKTKIEPGCMVMVHKSFDENNGKFATAIRYVGALQEFSSRTLWLLDTDMMSRDLCGPGTYLNPYMPEECLLRVDGHEENNHLIEKDREVVYS